MGLLCRELLDRQRRDLLKAQRRVPIETLVFRADLSREVSEAPGRIDEDSTERLATSDQPIQFGQGSHLDAPSPGNAASSFNILGPPEPAQYPASGSRVDSNRSPRACGMRTWPFPAAPRAAIWPSKSLRSSSSVGVRFQPPTVDGDGFAPR